MRILWRRLAVNPTTHIEAQSSETTRLKVEGLVCDTVCAARTGTALRKLDGVTSVHVDLDSGIATIEGTPHDAAAYESAVTGAVAGKPVRRLIEAVSTKLRGSQRKREVSD